MLEPGRPRAIELRGQVVKIFDQQDQCLVSVALLPLPLLDLVTRDLGEARLGDGILIRAHLTVDSIDTDSSAKSDPGPRIR